MIPIGFMFIHCTQGAQDQLLQKVKEIPGVEYAYKLDKMYDLVIKLESDSIEEFTSAIARIRSAGSILNTDTMVGFKK
jgi:DNA-binding Lrp family transcriptional regulator